MALAAFADLRCMETVGGGGADFDTTPAPQAFSGPGARVRGGVETPGVAATCSDEQPVSIPVPVAARSDGSISGVAHEWTSPQGRREGLRPNTTGDPWPGRYASDRTRPVVSDHRDRRRIEQRPVAVDAVAQGARDVLVRDAQPDRADLV